jgi:predicted alpha/beta hydrolase family esterase
VPRSFLILHGYEGSGPAHWQSWLADRLRRAGEDVAYPDLPDPEAPRLPAWRAALEDALRALPGEPVVLCHSLACILWLHHCADRPRHGGAAERVLLVAPPSARAGVDALLPFFPVPLDPARIAAAARETRIVCAADPYCPEGAEALYGDPLGLPVDRLPDRAGHINVEAGFGPWPAVERWCYGGGPLGRPVLVERPGDRSSEEHEDDDRLGYRNVDEEGAYDERGSQGPGPGEPPPEEEERKPAP